VLLRGRENDETPVDLVRIEILIVAKFFGDLWGKPGAVDLERGQLGSGQPEGNESLIVALDEMRLLDGKEPSVNEVVVAQQIHDQAFQRPFCLSSSISRAARSRRR